MLLKIALSMVSATWAGLNGLHGRENRCDYILSRFDRDDRLPKIPNDSLQTRTLISGDFQNLPIPDQVFMVLRPIATYRNLNFQDTRFSYDYHHNTENSGIQETPNATVVYRMVSLDITCFGGQ